MRINILDNSISYFMGTQPKGFTQNSLQWFITEQLEEVSSTEELLQIVQRAGDGGLLFVEHYLANTGTSAGR